MVRSPEAIYSIFPLLTVMIVGAMAVSLIASLLSLIFDARKLPAVIALFINLTAAWFFWQWTC